MRTIEEFLKKEGITPTPVRLLVWRCLRESKVPLSLTDIEMRLDSVDKSTISRTLTLFRGHHLLHSFNDGSGSVKYEICSSKHLDRHDDFHVHFRCELCGQTICLTEVGVPEVVLPEGFQPNEINYVISGICAECNKKNP